MTHLETNERSMLKAGWTMLPGEFAMMISTDVNIIMTVLYLDYVRVPRGRRSQVHGSEGRTGLVMQQ